MYHLSTVFLVCTTLGDPVGIPRTYRTNWQEDLVSTVSWNVAQKISFTFFPSPKRVGGETINPKPASSINYSRKRLYETVLCCCSVSMGCLLRIPGNGEEEERRGGRAECANFFPSQQRRRIRTVISVVLQEATWVGDEIFVGFVSEASTEDKQNRAWKINLSSVFRVIQKKPISEKRPPLFLPDERHDM